ncbi:MAG: hypothetical protein PHC61_17645, partial [Chitinivibrionales bacterium]|nr:hypothetical protein [Chitinivibrionales bacterium]
MFYNGTSASQTLQSLPIFVVLDSIYSKNENSPVAGTKPAAIRYGELLQRVDEVLLRGLAIESAVTTRNMPFTSIFSIAEMIILSMTKTEDVFLQVMNPHYSGNFIPGHSLNVAFLSCKVGMGLKFSYKELTEVCVAAILHDLGMTKIAPDCYYHDR